MSDIPVDVPLDVPEEPVDQAFLDLIAKLGPVFNEVAKAAITEAIAATPTVTYRPGVVQGVSTTNRTASVLLDGDSSPVTAQILDDHPWLNARVMVEFVPPSAVFVAGIISSSPLPAGVMMPYAGPITVHADASTATPTSNQPPPGWLWCAGQAVSRTTYSALYTAIGTSAGAGDGATTFNVPDYRGRTFLGIDNMGGSDAGRLSAANTLLGTGGAETITVGQTNLPNVNFTVSATVDITDPGHDHSVSNLVSTTQGGTAGTDFTADKETWTSTTGSRTTGITAALSGATAASGGSGTAINTLPPYALCHVIIKC